MNRDDSDKETKNPFLGRILAEPYLCTSKDFHVVRDRCPVTEGHYLLFTKAQVPSLADTDLGLLHKFVRDKLTEHLGEDYNLIERGRALTCTSFEVVHAHAHMVPAGCSKAINQSLGRVRSYKFESLKNALSSIEKDKSYLLWGQLGGCFEVAYGIEDLPKRFIRNLIATEIEGRENNGGDK